MFRVLKGQRTKLMLYLPAITRHCVHQHLAMGSWLFLAPIKHQGQFVEAGHKV